MYRRRYRRRYFAPAAPKEKVVRTEDEWTVKTDSAGRKRYYKNDCFMSLSAVPNDVYERLKNESVVKFPIVQEYSYFDALPLDLKKLLMLYFSVHNIRKLCDLPMFSAIYNNED